MSRSILCASLPEPLQDAPGSISASVMASLTTATRRRLPCSPFTGCSKARRHLPSLQLVGRRRRQSPVAVLVLLPNQEEKLFAWRAWRRERAAGVADTCCHWRQPPSPVSLPCTSSRSGRSTRELCRWFLPHNIPALCWLLLLLVHVCLVECSSWFLHAPLLIDHPFEDLFKSGSKFSLWFRNFGHEITT